MTRGMVGWVVMALLMGVATGRARGQSAEPWDRAYAGEDAVGKHVIGLWTFEGDGSVDASGRGYGGKLEGATIHAEGKFGAALESARGWPVKDARHRYLVKQDARLTPRGAFTLEMWIKPGAELNAEYPESFLVDKKYVAHADYQMILGAAEKSGARALVVNLGFGAESATWRSRGMRFEAGKWYHIAFTYDAAGTGAFYVNGVPAGKTTHAGRAAIVGGNHPLSIGDRVGSLFHGFPGRIDQVRLCEGVLEFARVKVEAVSERFNFRRMEGGANLSIKLTNLQRQACRACVVNVTLEGQARSYPVAVIEAGQSTTIEFPIDTALRPDGYRVSVTFKSEEPAIETADSFAVRIVPRPLPDRYPVVMWGVYGNVPEESARLKEIGFTHVLGFGADYERIWKAGKVTAPQDELKVREVKRMLDQALADDLTIAASLSPGHWLTKEKELLRVNRKGQSDSKHPDICGLDPRIEAYCQNVGESIGRTYGAFPSFGAALIHTEVRDAAGLCFHPHDLEAYRKASGREIPAEAVGKSGVDYSKLRNFPGDRIIADDDPLLTYYRWFWKEGDGWNRLTSAVHRGLKVGRREDVWTWHDPAVRVAKAYGSGGSVDVISQWTYSYPDPIRIGIATDELLAMARGAGAKQEVMKMTQIIWYRGQTAPQAKEGAPAARYQAQWEREQPDAPFITIAPMQLREAFWTKIARPIRGIMYHGWQSLVPCEGTVGYRYTNPQTQHELARLIEKVVRPLGPTLLRVPGSRSDVAFLQSFASEMFAKRGTYGWSGKWNGDAYLMLMYAQLQPEIVFDETVVQKGLEGYRVLVMMDCDVITVRMAERIRAFQAGGGLLIGDERLAPGIKADITLNSRARSGRADEDQKALLALAGELRGKLDGRYTRQVDSSDALVIPHVRHDKGSDYLFLINDHREFGSYVGQHGIVMENGLPARAMVRLARKDGFAYDLVEHRELELRKTGKGMEFESDLGPCDGRMILVTDQRIAGLKVETAQRVERGGEAGMQIEVVDEQGKRVSAVVPVEVEVRDPQGRRGEFSGYYAAVDGKLEIRLNIARNDEFGLWQVKARELASGRAASASFRVAAPADWAPGKKEVGRDAANPVQPKG